MHLIQSCRLFQEP